MSEKHEVQDHTLNLHEQTFKDHTKDIFRLQMKSGTYLTIKMGITIFLAALITLSSTYIGSSYIQSQTFLEIRRQDQMDFIAYKIKTDLSIQVLDRNQVALDIKQDTFAQLQAEVRARLLTIPQQTTPQ